jgi:anti-sigma regulatory factor (Ser/Thr protein kinase)
MSSPKHQSSEFVVTHPANPRQEFMSEESSQTVLSLPSPRKDDSGDGSTWVFQSYLELDALPVAPSRARMHARAMLTEWGLKALSDETDLVITELTTNAMQASEQLQEQPCAIRVWLLSDAVRLVIVVWDASRQLPQLAEASLDAMDGRGLQIVAALSNDWGWYGRSDMAGKCVWSEIVTTPEIEFLA